METQTRAHHDGGIEEQIRHDHPPRAARDVRELGIQLETFRVVAANGRKIAAYRFAVPCDIVRTQIVTNPNSGTTRMLNGKVRVEAPPQMNPFAKAQREGNAEKQVDLI